MSWLSWRVATIRGIPLFLDWSVLVTLTMILFEYGGWGIGFAGLLGIGFFVSIALHELGHAWVAQKKGCRVRRIRLTCIGGIAEMESLPRRPLDELLMASAGPAVSLFIGIVLLAGARCMPIERLRTLFAMVGAINLVLLVFNLLPAFPMDGGRIFRSVLVPRFGRRRATRIAARLGRTLAVMGGLAALMARHPLLLVIAIFVFLNATREQHRVEAEETVQTARFPFWYADSSDGPLGDPGGDQATISPPPYRRGPASQVPIRPTRHDFVDNPFDDGRRIG